MTIERAKQIALLTAMVGATVYKFLEEIDRPNVKVITNAGVRKSRRAG
jgi:hypothetical protein